MSISTIDVASTNTEVREYRRPAIHRSAFYLPGRNEHVFAWLHQSHRRFDHGVLICPPIGHEQLHAHRSLRYLAESLAMKDISTVRFDWHGTGDSPGGDQDQRRIDVWLENIHDGVQWMREHLGCRKISLIGLRIGATLASLATAREQIENLVLWCPVTKGRAFVREMKALSLTSGAPFRPAEGGSSEIEAGGFILSPETADKLSGIDLMQCRPECGQVLVVSRADLREEDRLCNHWAKLGVHVRQISTHGYAEMMAEPHRSVVPHHAIQQMTDWLTHSVSFDTREADSSLPAQRKDSISFSTRSMGLGQSEPNQTLRESTFGISQNPHLFGILTEPEIADINSKPTIVLLNAGSAHRVAPSRLNTLIARRLAAEGFRCLRLDLCGLGDSILDCSEHENDSYPATAFRDIDITLKQAQQRLGAERIVLMGLCSGAYAAFQSAAQIENPALVESILINPLTFFWKEGMSLDASPTKHLMSFHYYRRSALDPRKWMKLITGKSRLGMKGAIQILARRVGLIKDSNSAVPLQVNRDDQKSVPSHPAKDDLPGDLKKITDLKRQLTMFFSKSDPGFSILNYHARRKVNELRARGRMSITFIDGADHTFSRNAARNELIELIATHLEKRYRENGLH